jgi:flavin-dependent dehydrogenase
MTTDLVIVGGGPAGLATAIAAAERGLEAVVVERRTLPLDKPCGEGLMPGAVRSLATMGVAVPAWGRTPFIGVRYVDGDVVAEGRFPGGPGWGVRRTALVDGMVARARTLGVTLRYGCAPREWRRTGDGVELATDDGGVRARLLVGADGLRSAIRRDAGLDRPRRGRRRFGMRRHYAIAPWSPFVEVHWSAGAEAYVTPAGPGRIGLAFLWDGDGTSFDELLARFPPLAARIDGATPESEVCGAGPLRRDAKARYADRVALVGDAAGYLDALTGEGLTLAFESARALVDVVARRQPLAEYETAYRRLSRTYYLLTGLMLWVAAHAALRRRVVAAFARRPELFDRMLAINAGEWPLSSLGVGGVVRLLHGVLR